ncbi:LPS-assembly protein LptD [Sphingomicrobium marinum]|uniref:LPS-assembly protein LptD n=1 Tax=Sphingomicrobium marinum TaxID=1227950 RepID=UPI00223F4460|nr:LPS assembly protein LptD [Sphingomicrobium marinum]
MSGSANRLLSGASLLILGMASPALAAVQDDPSIAAAAQEDLIVFSADEIAYDGANQVVTATGQVRANRDGYYVAADRVTWDRSTGLIVAEGNVVLLSPTGDRVIGDHVELDEAFSNGMSENLLLALDTGGRIAAERATSVDGDLTLENAIYSPCTISPAAGCPENPSWSIRAAQVIRDAETGTLTFKGGQFTFFGVALPAIPSFSIGQPGPIGGITGFLVPEVAISGINGLEISQPYYWRLARNRDFTLTPTVYSGAFPSIEAFYRQLTTTGAVQVGGFLTYGEVEDELLSNPNAVLERDVRGYLEANGRLQFDENWRLTGSGRVASDKTVTRRYDITRDDRLRSFLNLERFSEDAYISIAGWAFQGLRVDDELATTPVALPAIDARWRLSDLPVGGRVELQANSLAILRVDGQDTQRAFAGARWDRRLLTNWGQELTLTAYARGDVYHTNNVLSTNVEAYRGEEGWNFRGIGALAADMRYPLIGPAFGGTQRIVPRIQLVVTPRTENLDIPNEDARAIDLEDSNLFALNRFPGYDRWDDGSRVTYGVEYMLDIPNVSIRSNIGQSYRLNQSPDIFPDGTGLTDRFSDIVGRTRVRYGRFLDFTHRFRIDKDDLKIRRTELDLTLGTIETYAQIGYLLLDRDIDISIEDLRDKEELRGGGRVKIDDNWSAFGSVVLDLTNSDEDPLSLADGFEPTRHRVGVSYEDDALEVGLTWRRDYERAGLFDRGSTFQIRVILKGLGR